MRNLTKTLLVLILSQFVANELYGQNAQVTDLIRYDKIVMANDLVQVNKRIHRVAQAAISKGEKPGEFKNVTYRYSAKVRPLSDSQKRALTMKQDGILDVSGAKTFAPSPDSVYIDPESDLIFQTEVIDDKQMLMLRPGLSDVFDDIDIPAQEVKVTLANTTSLAPGTEASSSQSDNNYAIFLKFDSVTFPIDTADGGSFSVTLVGQVSLTNPRVEGKYSKNGGYNLIFRTTEMADLKVYSTVKVAKEIKKPLWGTELKAGNIGKCELGLFLLIDMDGEVSLCCEIDQGIDVTLGAKGGTFYYIPTSIRNISAIDHWCEVGYRVEAKVKTFAGLQCSANLKFKGYDILDVYANGGMEGTVNTDGVNLNADIGFRVKAGGKVVSKKFTLVDKYFSLWKMQKADFKGYDMIIHEACAYGDYVAGEIRSLVDSKTIPGIKDTIPYKGNLTVVVRHPDNKTAEFRAQTDDKGLFIARSVPLRKGDKIMVKIPGVSSASTPVDATIPFKEINLWAADYYAGIAEGSIAGSRSKWAKVAAQQAAGNIPANVSGIARPSAAVKALDAINKPAAVKRIEDFRNSLTIYKGPIEFVSQATNETIGLTGNARPATRSYGTDAKATPNKGVVDSPIGYFSISGLIFLPGEKVKARINLEGFTIESEWIETEGLLVSEINHISLSYSHSLRDETVSAANSFIIISPIRSETIPTGSVRLLKGADAPHSSMTNPVTVPEFPGADKARLWFDINTTLKKAEGTVGVAIAETGPWSIKATYSSPGDIINPAKNSKHPFEIVTYVYKDKDLGYSIFIDECVSCTSPVQMAERFNSLQNTQFKGKTGKQVTKAVKQPAVQPGTGGRLNNF